MLAAAGGFAWLGQNKGTADAGVKVHKVWPTVCRNTTRSSSRLRKWPASPPPNPVAAS